MSIESERLGQLLSYIALGSNLGDSWRNVLRAMEHLQELSDAPLLKSSLYETAPVYCPPGSPVFVNAAVGLLPSSGETPESLLGKLLELERKFGRRPKQLVNEPRPLDLDLIVFGQETRNSPALILPHPRAHLRRFVLVPLNEIAPTLVLPRQRKSVSELLDALVPDETVRRIG